jgi:hypothetical protein
MIQNVRFIFLVIQLVILINAIGWSCSNASDADNSYKWDDQAPICYQTSQVAQKACEKSTQVDYFLSMGTCHNLLGVNEREDCLTNTQRVLGSQLNECKEQFEARNEICKEIGGGAYDPQIVNLGFIQSFKYVVGNRYFPLKPGTVMIYRRVAPNGNESTIRRFIHVTNQQKKILGVTCRAVQLSTETKEGKLMQYSLGWYAQDRDGAVWGFGETAYQYDLGLIAGTEGSWNAGVNGAVPGISMYADPKSQIGKTYRQQLVLGKVENVARVAGMIDKLPLLKKNSKLPKTVHGPYLQIQEFSPLNPNSLNNPINKFYAPGVGLVLIIAPDGTQDVLLSIEQRLEIIN